MKYNSNNRPVKNGFGLLEVLISSAILILVSGAVISLNNISVKNTVVASERTQAYNLAREWKEQLKQIRDTYVNDENSTTCFSISLAGSPCSNEIPNDGTYIINSLTNTINANSAGEDVALDNIVFTRAITFKNPPDVLPSLTDANPNISLSDQVREADIIVSWTEYGKPWSITVPVLLTNWAAI